MGKHEQTPSNSQRLSRTEKRAAARKHQKELRSKGFFERHAKKIYTGTAVTVGGALVVGGVILLRGQDGRTPLPPTTTAQQANTEQSLQQNKLIIQQETKRLSVKTNIKEQETWSNVSFDISDKKFPVNEATLNIALDRLVETGNLMQKSENPYFQHAVSVISSLTDPNVDKLSTKILPELIADGSVTKKGEQAVMGIQPTIKDGKIHYVLQISGDRILNNSNALSIALTFVHEVRHLDDFLNYERLSDQDPSLTIEQKLAAITRRQDNPKEILTDEARAYGEDSKAFIFQTGLGIKGNVQDDRVNRAANFISFGNNTDNEEWKAFIASKILPPGSNN
ncbi:MAG: hypothetical protein Q7K55_05180 [Candidatus Levybacteria bacterium]|nr:hypothetical protein [Candidatus Levybacteria bacterium]